MDTTVIEFLNQFANSSPLTDRLIGLWANNKILKGGVITALFCWAWFSLAAESRERKILFTTLLATPVIILAARMLALYLPFRARPIHNESLDFELPAGISRGTLDGWSSFPSDHAVLYFGLAVGMFAASKRLGVVAIAYALIFIGLPRVYLGLHYPSDVLGGAAIGGALMLTAIYLFSDSRIMTRIDKWAEGQPGLFYALSFLVLYQVADLFGESRKIASIIAHSTSP